MPNKSNASRSNQLTEAQTSHSEATIGTSSSSANTFKRTRWFRLTDSRCDTMQ